MSDPRITEEQLRAWETALAGHAVVNQLITDIRRLREALERIDRDGCERLTGPTRCFDVEGWSRDARYGADAWCNPCIARKVLSSDV